MHEGAAVCRNTFSPMRDPVLFGQGGFSHTTVCQACLGPCTLEWTIWYLCSITRGCWYLSPCPFRFTHLILRREGGGGGGGGTGVRARPAALVLAARHNCICPNHKKSKRKCKPIMSLPPFIISLTRVQTCGGSRFTPVVCYHCVVRLSCWHRELVTAPMPSLIGQLRCTCHCLRSLCSALHVRLCKTRLYATTFESRTGGGGAIYSRVSLTSALQLLQSSSGSSSGVSYVQGMT